MDGDRRKSAGAAMNPADGNILARICADKRAHIAARGRETPLAEIRAKAAAATPPRGFAAALKQRVAAGDYGLIAEIKRASPSRGVIRADFDAAALARAYRQGGAACLSVLTDGPWFGGANADLQNAAAAVDLPLLRKDFMLDPWQIYESRAIGADCVLLIMAALADDAAAEMAGLARELGMDVLVEVHDRAELQRAIAMGATMIGVNSRDLKSLTIDLDAAAALIRALPAGCLAVAESGLYDKTDLDRMAAAGARCFLVGESLMRSPDVAAATHRLLHGQGPRTDQDTAS